MAAFGDETPQPTDRAKEAEAILERATVIITLEEREELKRQSEERRINKSIEEVGERMEYPTENARQAKEILTSPNLWGAVGEQKEKALFTAIDIGKATLEQQKQTEEKKKEEEHLTKELPKKDSKDIE